MSCNEINIVLPGTPVSTQHLYGTNKQGFRYMNNEGKATKKQYIEIIKKHYGGKIWDGNVILDVKFYFADRRRRDVDNFSKILNDSMSELIYKDDSQIIDQRIRKFLDKKNPRIEIYLRHIPKLLLNEIAGLLN